MVEATNKVKALEIFRKAPAGFATQVLGVDPKLHQVVILNSIRDNRRTLVTSCNSIGKDFIAGVATHWFLQIWDEVLVITTAPTGEQVKNIQWKEIRHFFLNSKVPLGGEMPEVEPTYRLGSKRMAFGLATREEAERLQGHHEAHILIIITEGSAVSEEVFTGIRALMASGDVHLLVLSNPTRNDGEVYEIAQGNRAGWNHIEISGFELPNLQACQKLGEEHMNLGTEELEERNECPNPAPFLLSHFFEAECREDFGPDSDYYAIHVLGRFGMSGSDQLIPRDWIDLAFDREADPDGRIGAGLDIGRGRDKTAYCEFDGNSLTRVIEKVRLEVTQTEGWIRRDILLPNPDLPMAIDDTGLGGGVAPHLAEDFKRVYGIDFSEKADDEKRFANKPTEMYFKVRKRLDPAGNNPLSFAAVPRELRQRFTQHLLRPRYMTDDSKGRLRVDKKGGGSESPDMFDALALALEAQQRFLWSGLRMHQPSTRDEDEEESGRATFAGIRERSF